MSPAFQKLVPVGTSHFVLLGVAVRVDQWKTLDSNIEREQSAFNLADVELHAGSMARRYVEQESVANFEAIELAARRASVEQVINRRAGVLGVAGNQKKIKAYRLECRKISPYIHLTAVKDSRVFRRLPLNLRVGLICKYARHSSGRLVCICVAQAHRKRRKSVVGYCETARRSLGERAGRCASLHRKTALQS